jgi:alpha-galactosidase
MSTAPFDPIVMLACEGLCVVVDATDTIASIAYIGSPLVASAEADVTDAFDLAGLVTALKRPVSPSSPDRVAPLGIVPEHGSGWQGRPGLEGRRANGAGWAPRFTTTSSTRDEHAVSFRCVDEIAGLVLTLHVGIETAGPLVTVRAELENTGTTAYELSHLALTVPLGAAKRELIEFSGRWAREFHTDRRQFDVGVHVVENRRGRTSHDRIPLTFVGDAGFSETSGEVLGAHLAWSGNHHLRVERLTEGRAYLQAGELLFPGEVLLEPGDVYATPTLYLAHSPSGLGAASEAFHRFVRSRPSHPSHPSRPRPVLVNTWEAVYFDHDRDRLFRLAVAAAEVGAERFVLDDGWFHGRRHDRAGLGDWWVDPAVYPEGLTPLIEHVHALGMEFGLWIEPEMVNPDSNLFRDHPDWALVPEGYEPVTARHQLVLDLTNGQAFAHVLGQIDAVLHDNSIEFVKWDMNRDLVHASHLGRAAAHAQTLAMYRLFDELTTRHPHVEFESCSSGGGRADFEMLRWAVRIWTSDCNDALERQRIQRGFSHFLPPELMGAHIGPPRSHTTGRTHQLAFRAATALFGHLGVEWNLLDADADERQQLAAVIALHKRLRPLLHSGTVIRLDHPDTSGLAHGVVSSDRSEAVFSYAQMATSAAWVPAPLRFNGLDPERRYRLASLPLGAPIAWSVEGLVLSGRQLTAHGVQLPVLLPESAFVMELTAERPRDA